MAPAAAAFLAVRIAGPAFWRTEGWPGAVVFLVQGLIVGSAAALLAGRAARRLLPLAALLNMTLVFPDRVPSRFGMALRTGTVRQLKCGLKTGAIDWPRSHQEAAELLVVLVAELAQHDRLTRGHTERVRAYADLIGEEMDLSSTERELLHWGAMAHDIGKLAVPAEILNRPGGPSDEDWEILRQHPVAGGDLVAPLADWLGDWRLAASEHHERWDGRGYPLGLAGTDISLAGRIVAVADAFDVITSKRTYKEPMSLDAARQEMARCAGTQFDPEVVRALLTASIKTHHAAFGTIGWLLELRQLSVLPQALGQAATVTAAAAAIVTGTLAGLAITPTSSAEPAASPYAITAHADQPAQLLYAEPNGETGSSTDSAEIAAGRTEGDPTEPPLDEAEPSPTEATTNAAPESGPEAAAGATTTRFGSSTTLLTTATSGPGTNVATTASTSASASTTTRLYTTTTTARSTTTAVASTTTTAAAPTTTTTTTTTTAPTTTTPPANAVIGYSAIGPAATRTSSGSLVVSVPSGTNQNDLLLLVEVNTANQAITTPSGWTLAADTSTSSPKQFRFTVWHKLAGPAETTVTLPVNTNSSGATAWVIRYRDPDGYPPNPTAATATISTGTGTATATLTPSPDITTNIADARIISLVAVRDANATSLATSRGFTLQTSTSQSATGQPRTLGIADISELNSGTTPASPTWSQTGTPAQWAWATLAFS